MWWKCGLFLLCENTWFKYLYKKFEVSERIDMISNFKVSVNRFMNRKYVVWMCFVRLLKEKKIDFKIVRI